MMMEYRLKDGQVVNVRPLKANEDVFALTEYINSLVEEDTWISMNEPMTPEKEADWLRKKVADVEAGKCIHWVGECGGKIVAGVEANRGMWREKDVVEFGIAIVKGFRGQGLGRFLLSGLIKEAKEKFKPRILSIRYFEGNERAKALYEKLGFREVARLPKWTMYKGVPRDHVLMVLE